MFDTLLYAKRLEAAGMTREQAEAQVNVIAEMVVDGVATKQDIALTKSEMAKEFADVRTEFVAVRAEFVAVRAEIAEVRSEFRTEFAKFRVDLSEMRTDIANVRLEIHKESLKNLKIMGGMFVASTTLTIGVLGLLLK